MDTTTAVPKLTKATCLECGYATGDSTSLELWNGYGDCPNTGHRDDDTQRVEWLLSDGTGVYTHYRDGREIDRIEFVNIPVFSGDWEWNEDFECFETAFTPVRYEPPWSGGVVPVVSPDVMAAIVARFQFFAAARAQHGDNDHWSWDGNGVRVVQFDAHPMDDNHATWLLPDGDGNFDLGPLGFTFVTVGDDQRVMRTV